MDLVELEPEEVSIALEGLLIKFRPFTLADDIRNTKKYGGPDKMAKIFSDFDFEKISRIAWDQITLDCQRTIVLSVAGATMDGDTGKEIPLALSPIEKFQNLFSGLKNQISLLTTLVKCKGLNIPDIDIQKKGKDQKESLPTGP